MEPLPTSPLLVLLFGAAPTIPALLTSSPPTPSHCLPLLLLPAIYSAVLFVFLTGWHEYPLLSRLLPYPLLCLFLYATLSSSMSANPDAINGAVFYALITLTSYYSCAVLYNDIVLGPAPTTASDSSLKSRVYLVTGGNAGIGYSTAVQLLRREATVVILSRSLARGNKAATAMLQECPSSSPSSIHVIVCDLCSYPSIRAAAASFSDLSLPLHSVILNAGVMLNDRDVTAAGDEATVAANHLGHFLLTSLLLPHMKQKNTRAVHDARIVTVGSSTHFMANKTGVFLDDLRCERRNYTLFGQYSQSKLMNVMFSGELARRLENNGHINIKAYCVHPGLVRTNVHQNMNNVIVMLHNIFSVVLVVLMKPQEYGAVSSVMCATDVSVEGESGKYYFNGERRAQSKWADDADAGEKLWRVSEKAVGLKKGEFL